MKEQLISQLEKFDYDYEQHNSWVKVKLDRSLHVTIDFSKEGKCTIKEKLVGWNVLTGIFDMSIGMTLAFNSVFAFIFMLLLIFLSSESNSTIGVTIALFFYVIINVPCFFYYLIKYESFKKQVMEWVG